MRGLLAAGERGWTKRAASRERERERRESEKEKEERARKREREGVSPLLAALENEKK